ncbi:MAG TPA: alpha/beta fold hydrolase [Myxococcales bacterium]|nr:alpha/beta fold hydrolase [Myxococcales bacterium]
MFVTASDGVRLHVVEQGRASGDTVLWLQGLNAPAAAWAVQLAHFSANIRSIAPDARGVGQSDAPPGPYTTRQMAGDAVRVLDAAKVERAHIVALSLGGAVAQELALAHPDRVRTLALLSTFAAQSPRSRALLEAWRILYPRTEQDAQLRTAWELQAYSWLFTDRFWRSDSNVRAALKFARTQPPQSAAGFVGQVDAALSHDARDRLPALKAPTLVIHGAIDQLAPVAGAEELARLIPGARLLVLPDIGHAVNVEAQRPVNNALRELWRLG